jgi:TPR repeat protein
MYALGRAYEFADGTRRSPALAVHWYQRAAALGLHPAKKAKRDLTSPKRSRATRVSSR